MTRHSFSMGSTPWNKGLKYSEEMKSRLNLSGLVLGRHAGKKHSEETRKKISNVLQKKIESGWKNNKWFKKGVSVNIGSNHPNWKGGTSRPYKDGYYSVEYKKWRISVFERDNYTCQECGFVGSKGYITAHHIKSFAKYPHLRYDVDNGKTLCIPCHSLTDNYKGRGRRKQ